VLTDLFGRTTVGSLYAVGECACTGLHGANRLAGNSLAECLVFACRAADDIGGAVPAGGSVTGSDEPRSVSSMDRVEPLRALMWEGASVVRTGDDLRRLLDRLEHWPLAEWPISRAALESRPLLTAARYITHAALIREESRGAHYRTDFPERDDEHWLARIVWNADGYVVEPIAAPAAT